MEYKRRNVNSYLVRGISLLCCWETVFAGSTEKTDERRTERKREREREREGRVKEKEGLKSREARKDCEKENERLENSRPWLLSYLSQVRRRRSNIPPIERQGRNTGCGTSETETTICWQRVGQGRERQSAWSSHAKRPGEPTNERAAPTNQAASYESAPRLLRSLISHPGQSLPNHVRR